MTVLAAQHAVVRRGPRIEETRGADTADIAWFSVLYRDNFESVYRFARMLVRDHFLAEDVAEEAFLRAWKARHSFRNRSASLTWVLSITRNCAADIYRSGREVVDLETIADLEDRDDGHKESALFSEENRKALHDAMGRLTEEQQLVVFLRFYRRMPHDQIAKQLGKNANAVRAIQFRALSRLRRLMGVADG
ncbi:MAG: sigma-70 family RNA polymerase sigma factor [Dehalococcoidia bacterium]